MNGPPAERGLADRIRAGDREALARGITLVESTRPEDHDRSERLLADLAPHAGGAHRMGITGVPGVGKSTFIEALGTHLTGQGRRVAVLAVDPSSSVSGGSILGDKTRMEALARDPAAFIRPSPSGRSAGGVGRRTREAALLCEAAGFDVLLIETVGTGQAEAAVAEMVDFFLLLILPGAGDELQGIKRGVMELADAVVVNKADGTRRTAAQQAQRQLAMAVGLLTPTHPEWRPPVLLVSTLEGRGLAEVWEQVQRHHDLLADTGQLQRERRRQALAWMESTLQDLLLEDLYRSPAVQSLLPGLRDAVLQGSVQPTAAARRLLEAARGATGPDQS